MAVPYPVTNCTACNSPIQGIMILVPTDIESGKYTAEPFHATCFGTGTAATGIGLLKQGAELLEQLAPERGRHRRRNRDDK